MFPIEASHLISTCREDKLLLPPTLQPPTPHTTSKHDSPSGIMNAIIIPVSSEKTCYPHSAWERMPVPTSHFHCFFMLIQVTSVSCEIFFVAKKQSRLEFIQCFGNDNEQMWPQNKWSTLTDVSVLKCCKPDLKRVRCHIGVLRMNEKQMLTKGVCFPGMHYGQPQWPIHHSLHRSQFILVLCKTMTPSGEMISHQAS